MEQILVFEMGRQGSDLEVALPVEWARPTPTVEVPFHWSNAFGWHVHVHGQDGWHALSFPWTDHVDEILLGAGSGTLPVGDQPWWDLEQGWWGVVKRDGDRIFVAETDFDAICDTSDETLSLRSQGEVLVGHVPVRWTAVPRQAWVDAWDAARRSCELGTPAPSVQSWSC
jgi:hypothetical protein